MEATTQWKAPFIHSRRVKRESRSRSRRGRKGEATKRRGRGRKPETGEEEGEEEAAKKVEEEEEVQVDEGPQVEMIQVENNKYKPMGKITTEGEGSEGKRNLRQAQDLKHFESGASSSKKRYLCRAHDFNWPDTQKSRIDCFVFLPGSRSSKQLFRGSHRSDRDLLYERMAMRSSVFPTRKKEFTHAAGGGIYEQMLSRQFKDDGGDQGLFMSRHGRGQMSVLGRRTLYARKFEAMRTLVAEGDKIN